MDRNSHGKTWPATIKEKNLLGTKHEIFVCSDPAYCAPNINFNHLVVPPHHYFFMGDNRNNSEDSIDWGFVPEEKLIGKLRMVVFSWDSEAGDSRRERIGTRF